MFKVYVQVRYYTFTTSHFDILSTIIHTSISVSLHIHHDDKFPYFHISSAKDDL